MSTVIPPRAKASPRNLTLGIVASEYHQHLTDALLENTRSEFNSIFPKAKVVTLRVPGAFEIPVGVETLFQEEKISAIIALGVIIKGETAHADLVARSVVDSLQKQAVEHKVPVINEVLFVDNKQQAKVRCIDKEVNRGVEAARAAASVIISLDEYERNKAVSLRMHPSNV